MASAHERLKTDFDALKKEFNEFKEATLAELLDRSDNPNIPISRLDRLESQLSKGFWRRLLHLKPKSI